MWSQGCIYDDSRGWFDALESVLSFQYIPVSDPVCLVSVALTSVVILVVPPAALGAVYYGRYVRKLSQKTQRAVAESISLAEEKLGAIKTIHAFNGIELETRAYKERIEKVFDLYKKEAYATGFFFGSLVCMAFP